MEFFVDDCEYLSACLPIGCKTMARPREAVVINQDYGPNQAEFSAIWAEEFSRKG